MRPFEAARAAMYTCKYAPVAQLDRAAASGAVGREFESLRARQFISIRLVSLPQDDLRFRHPLATCDRDAYLPGSARQRRGQFHWRSDRFSIHRLDQVTGFQRSHLRHASWFDLGNLRPVEVLRHKHCTQRSEQQPVSRCARRLRRCGRIVTGRSRRRGSGRLRFVRLRFHRSRLCLMPWTPPRTMCLRWRGRLTGRRRLIRWWSLALRPRRLRTARLRFRRSRLRLVPRTPPGTMRLRLWSRCRSWRGRWLIRRRRSRSLSLLRLTFSRLGLGRLRLMPRAQPGAMRFGLGLGRGFGFGLLRRLWLGGRQLTTKSKIDTNGYAVAVLAGTVLVPQVIGINEIRRPKLKADPAKHPILKANAAGDSDRSIGKRSRVEIHNRQPVLTDQCVQKNVNFAGMIREGITRSK